MHDFVPKISHIVCTDRQGVIGIGNNLPWDIPEELEYFKEITDNSIIVMGHNTYKSIGKPLKNRINIVISKDEPKENTELLYYVSSIDSSLVLAEALAKKDHKNIFIIGGSSIYHQTFSYIDSVYISVVDISLKHYYKTGKYLSEFKYYKPRAYLKNFRLISNKTLNTVSTIRKVLLLHYEK